MAKPPLANDDVIRMVKAGLGEAVILQAIAINPGRFDLSPEGMAGLKSSGVGEHVIAAMAAARKATAHKAGLLDPGVYFKRTDTYADLPTETVAWENSSAAANETVGTLTRVRLIGRVQNRSSFLLLSGNAELLIVPDGGSVSEYQLLRAEVKGDSREFHAEAAVREGVVLGIAGLDRTVVATEVDRNFDLGLRVRLTGLRKGEYAIVTPAMFGDGRIAAATPVRTFTIE